MIVYSRLRNRLRHRGRKLLGDPTSCTQDIDAFDTTLGCLLLSSVGERNHVGRFVDTTHEFTSPASNRWVGILLIKTWLVASLAVCREVAV